MDASAFKWELSSKRKRIMLFLFGCLLGAAFFLVIYGFNVLDVQYVEWLMTGDDLTQHYLGWVFFRNSPWHFPIGLVDGLAYPALTSIMYTDSIPLFSLFFKLLSPMLPANFQFFGIWGIMSFMLQGGISSLIIYKIKESIPVALIGSVFFIISPVVLQRMYGHTALAGHFMILLPIAVWFYQDVFKKGYREYIVWGALGALAVSIHGYFVPMIGGFLCGYLLDNYILQGFNRKKLVSILGAYLACVLATMFVLGAFYGSVDMTGEFYIFSSNINSLFNSIGAYSIFLPGLPVGKNQYEGFAYLGAGMLVLAVVAIVLLLIWHNKLTKKPAAKLLANKKAHKTRQKSVQNPVKPLTGRSYLVGCLAFVAITFFLLAVGPADVSRARFIVGVAQIVKMFRAHGRFIWCTMYVIMLGAIGCVTNKISFRAGITLLTCCAVLQTVDLSGRMIDIHQLYESRVSYATEKLTSDKWQDIAKTYRHFVILPYDGAIVRDLDTIYEFATFASNHDMTLNQMYFSRPYDKSYELANANYMKQLAEGTVSDDTLFILEESALNEDVLNLNLSKLDGFVVGSKNRIEGLPQYEGENL